MSKEKLRGIIGSAIVIVFATLALALLALPMTQVIVKTTIAGASSTSTVASESIFTLFESLSNEAVDATMRASLVMFLLVAIVASLLIVLAIVHLVGVLLGNKKLNLTLLIQALSVALAVVGLLGLILCCAGLPDPYEYGTVTTTVAANSGSVLPFVMGLLAVAGAFVLPWHKAKKSEAK